MTRKRKDPPARRALACREGLPVLDHNNHAALTSFEGTLPPAFEDLCRVVESRELRRHEKIPDLEKLRVKGAGPGVSGKNQMGVPDGPGDREMAVRPSTFAPGMDRSDMAVRLYRAFEAQVEQVEARLKDLLADQNTAQITEIDRTAKTLASLAKTLGLLLNLNDAGAKGAAPGKVGAEKGGAGKDGEGADDDFLPDAASLRAELARRLGHLCPP